MITPAAAVVIRVVIIVAVKSLRELRTGLAGSGRGWGRTHRTWKFVLASGDSTKMYNYEKLRV